MGLFIFPIQPRRVKLSGTFNSFFVVPARTVSRAVLARAFFSAKPATMMWLVLVRDLEGDGSNLQVFVHEERMRILFSSRCSLSGNGVIHEARDQEVASIAYDFAL